MREHIEISQPAVTLSTATKLDHPRPVSAHRPHLSSLKHPTTSLHSAILRHLTHFSPAVLHALQQCPLVPLASQHGGTRLSVQGVLPLTYIGKLTKRLPAQLTSHFSNKVSTFQLSASGLLSTSVPPHL